MHLLFLIAFSLAYILFFTKAQLSSSEIQEVQEGLRHGGALLDLIEAKNFNETVRTLADSAGKFLNAVGPLVRLFLNSTTETKLMQTMKVDLAKINRRFSLMNDLHEIKNLVDMWYSIYSDEAVTISLNIEDLNWFMEAKTHEVRNSSSKNYKMSFCYKDNDAAGFNIYYTFTNKGLLLPRISVMTKGGNYSEKYRKEARTFMLYLTHLILRGAELEIACYGMELNETLMEEELAKKWKTRMGEVASQMRHVDETLHKALLSQRQNLTNITKSGSIIVLHHFDIESCFIICYFSFFMDYMQYLHL